MDQDTGSTSRSVGRFLPFFCVAGIRAHRNGISGVQSSWLPAWRIEPMVTKTEPFDAAAYLKTDEDIAAYMTEALATRDTAVIGRALGAIARARGMTRISRETGLSRE